MPIANTHHPAHRSALLHRKTSDDSPSQVTVVCVSFSHLSPYSIDDLGVDPVQGDTIVVNRSASKLLCLVEVRRRHVDFRCCVNHLVETGDDLSVAEAGYKRQNAGPEAFIKPVP